MGGGGRGGGGGGGWYVVKRTVDSISLASETKDSRVHNAMHEKKTEIISS